MIVIGACFAINWVYQVLRKPGEILAPVSASLAKSPDATWQSYGSLFEKHSTKIISPEFLASLAQVEGSGNPIASTYWRWRWSWNPFEIYRPASSAVGMFQITDGTFAEARKYCIRDHQVVADGPWHDVGSCWFNSFYSRTVPSHSIQLTAAYLHRTVVDTLAARPFVRSTPAQQQMLAAVIHLCGLKRGEILARRGFKLARGERCGSHNVARYLARIDLMKRRFVDLRRQSAGQRG
jgi:Transglycosylase SLT domain